MLSLSVLSSKRYSAGFTNHYFIKGLQVQFHESVPLHCVRLEAGTNFVSPLAVDTIQYFIPSFKNSCILVSAAASPNMDHSPLIIVQITHLSHYGKEGNSHPLGASQMTLGMAPQETAQAFTKHFMGAKAL